MASITNTYQLSNFEKNLQTLIIENSDYEFYEFRCINFILNVLSF